MEDCYSFNKVCIEDRGFMQGCGDSAQECAATQTWFWLLAVVVAAVAGGKK